jgi:hypothetical protein
MKKGLISYVRDRLVASLLAMTRNPVTLGLCQIINKKKGLQELSMAFA